MWLFFVLLILLVLFNFLSKYTKNQSKTFLILIFGVFAFLMMFKSSAVGNDTEVYIKVFKEVNLTSNLSAYIENSRMENGFLYLCRFLGRIWNDPSMLFIMSGAFVCFSFAKFIYKYSTIPWLSVLMFFTLSFYDLAFSGIRQVLSVAILLFAYDYIVKKKPIKFVLIVLLASTIHTSAIFFLMLYPLSAKKRKAWFYVLSSLIGILVAGTFSSFITAIARVFPRYASYFTDDEALAFSTELTLASVLMFALWMVLFLVANLAGKDASNEILALEEKKCGKDLNYIHQISTWLGCVMLFLSFQGTILNRFKFIFSAALILFYPNMINRIKKPILKYIILFVSCVVFIAYALILYIYRPEWQSTYPYSFFWND